jgi:hypothetical protein
MSGSSSELPNAFGERSANELRHSLAGTARQLAKHFPLALAGAKANQNAAWRRTLDRREWCRVSAHMQSSEILCYTDSQNDSDIHSPVKSSWSGKFAARSRPRRDGFDPLRSRLLEPGAYVEPLRLAHKSALLIDLEAWDANAGESHGARLTA